MSNEHARPLPNDVPIITPPIRPGPHVAAIAEISFIVILASSKADLKTSSILSK